MAFESRQGPLLRVNSADGNIHNVDDFTRQLISVEFLMQHFESPERITQHGIGNVERGQFDLMFVILTSVPHGQPCRYLKLSLDPLLLKLLARRGSKSVEMSTKFTRMNRSGPEGYRGHVITPQIGNESAKSRTKAGMRWYQDATDLKSSSNGTGMQSPGPTKCY